MADLAPVYEALRQADAAGDTAAAQKLAAYIKSYKPEPPKAEQLPESSAAGAFGRAALQEAAPTAAGVAAFGPGAAAGAALGAMTGPAAPVAVPVLGLAGGVAASMGAGAAMTAVQEKITSMVPDSLKDMVGLGKKQLQADQQQQPLATFAGRIAPQAAFMRPGMVSKAATGIGAGLGGGLEAGREIVQEKTIDPARVGIAAAAGATLQKPTAAGKALGLTVSPKVNEETRLRASESAAAAEEKVRAAGVDWSRLPRELRKNFAKQAQDATGFDKLTPDEIRMAARMNDLPVPIKETTKGQRTRDPIQLRREEVLAGTEEGMPIRQRLLDQNAKLTENLDYLKGKTRSTAKSESDVGRSVSDNALAKKADKSEKRISELYKTAEKAGETSAPVKTDPLLKHLAEHDDPALVSYVENRLRALKAVRADADGNLVPTRDLTLKELEGVRRAAVARGKNGGTEGYYAGQVKRVIDDMTKDAGGELYKQARAARVAHAKEFEDQRAVGKLIEDKTRTDRVTAVENVFDQAVVKGSVEDLQKVKRSLLTGGDAETRTAGRTALRDLRGQALQMIKEGATRSVATNEKREANFSPAGMRAALDKIGNEKLDVLFGKGTAKRIDTIYQAAVELKTQPSGVKTGSDTVQKLLTMLGGASDVVPVVGSIAKGAAKLGKKAYEAGTADKATSEALAPAKLNKRPLADINNRRTIAANEALLLQDKRKDRE